MMKHWILGVVVFGLCDVARAQLKIDEELVSDLVQAKQDELKTRFLKNLVYKHIKTTNNTTYNTMYDLVDILLTERNKTVMTDNLVHKVADYAVAYGTTWAFIKTKCEACDSSNASIHGFRPKKDPWTELGQAYRKAQGIKYSRDSLLVGAGQAARRDVSTKVNGGGSTTTVNLKNYGRSHGDAVVIDGETDFRIGLENWLLDTVHGLLIEDSIFNSIGLFEVDQERGWQYDVDYTAFWNTYRVSRRDSIVDELKNFIKVVKGAITTAKDLSSIGDAVGVDGASDLKGFDLKSLKNRNTATDPAGSITVPAQENKQIKAVVELFLKAVELYRDDVGQNSAVAKIADIITKYVILDPQQNDPLARFGFSIDVEAVVLSLEDRFVGTSRSPTMNGWLNVRPFFTIGLNYGYFSKLDNAFESDTTLGLRQIAWAGEKIGLKWHIWDWKYTRGQNAYEWFKFHGSYFRRFVRPRVPMISRWYASVYGSGLLYTIADLRTEKTFDYPIIGAGTGLEFFNGMEASISYAQPMITNSTPEERRESGFLNVAFDIPIFEYIRAARVKGKN